jgi:hypothetical protein
MRTIDIFVSSPADVQKERAVAEQSIRSVAAEFNLPIKVSYSDPLRGSKEEDEISVERENFGDESTFVLRPCFWEYLELEGDDFLEEIPNTGQYDLVICILWSRLGAALAQKCIMPDGGRPSSATDYEVAWVLDQSKRTPGFPGLRVYRNRATPAVPLEPKEKRENFCRQWDAVQEFCAGWEKNGGTEFRKGCQDYQDLEEFENLFRAHFRDFLTRQLDRETGSRKAPQKARHLESNPFRGLNFFDFEHAALYHGRTKAVGEVLDALKNQATAKKPFVLVVGPTGSGKSSLVRAGVLPLLTQGGTPVGNGPWRRAVTRPEAGGIAGDPFDTLAAALLGKFALPELQDEESPDEWRTLASQLRKDPDSAAARIAKILDQLTRQEMDLLDQRETEGLPARRSEGVEVVGQKSLGRVKPKMHLALVVDQLEELFTGEISPVLQRKYISALGALANCERVFIIATLRSDFYAHYQKFPELVELTALSGRYELQPPTPRGIGNMIRFPAEAAGLRFERDPDTNRGLDEALQEAAMASPEPLPLLEHLLSRLYQRQLDRKDGLLLWSDYRGLGDLQGALAQHAETVFLTLKRDEQQALRFVIRHLVAPGRGEEGLLIRRTVPYGDLVDQRQRAGARGLVDRLIKEGLLSADTNPKQELLISVPQEALLRRWPGVRQWLSEDRHFFRMRDRLDASLKLWLRRHRQSDYLLDRGIGLAEAKTLLRDFGSSLSERQIDYIQKSLARQKRRRRVRDNIGLAAIAGLAVLAAFAGIERFNRESQGKNRKQDVQLAQQNTDLASSQRTALETELKKAQEKAQLAQQNTDLASSQRTALETQLKKAEEKAQLAQQNADLASSQRSALETQLKKAQEEKAQIAQQNTDLASNQRTALETQLKKAEEKAQLAQQNADLASSQRTALETQLKKAEERVQLAQQNADLASSQRTALETELKKAQEEKTQLLKKAEEKAQLAQQNADLVSSQRTALETQLKKTQEEEAQLLKKAEEKAQLAQQNADLASSQRTALETQLKKAQEEKTQLLKKAEDKAQLAQQNTDLATSQRTTLETQLKKAQEEKTQLLKNAEDKAQLAQQNTDLASSQRTALETQLKKAEEKAQLAQQNADLVSSQRSALETQLKKAEEKAQLVQQNANLAASQRSALETQLKKAEEKAQLAQQNTDLATSQRSALETQLKKAQEDKALAQQNTDLATSQRGALETQLKKVQEEKAQLAQQNTDLATKQRSTLETQRGALETQLKKAQEEKAQLAQQNTDLATKQRSALETQLKKAEEEKAQLAQKNTDLATSQRSALETQLKKAQEDKALAQQNTDLATSQRSALETQLKKAEEKAQLAQQNTDLSSSQRTALKTELKKAQEEKAQLAQQNADLVSSQRSTLETQLKKAQEKAQLAQQNADLASSQRSALETQLKKAQEEKAQLAQQNTDLATSQRSALETQLKNDQVKLQQVQANAARQLSELEAQLRQEQERAQKAQAKADFATSELRGIRLVERVTTPLRSRKIQPATNDRNSDSRIGTDATFAWFMIGVNPEEKQTGLQWGKYARVNPAQDVSPIPSPSPKESETSNPPESQFDRSAEASGEAEFLKEFVLGYLRTVASNDTSMQRRYFAERVNFYGRGVLNSSNVEASTQHYHDEWPIREWAPRGEAKVVRSSNPNLFVVYQPFNWTVSDGSRTARGNATLYLRIRKNSQGEFRIVHVHQLDR